MTTPAAAAGSPGSPVAAPDQVAARDAVIGWYRGEFAAANAVIDALCGHLAQIGGPAEYDAVYAALHRRRLNWFPVLHMQKFYSINDVAAELRRVADARAAAAAATAYSEEEAASTVIHESPMDELVTVAAEPPVPEHVHEPMPQSPPAATEAQPNDAAVEADLELDGEDSSGDSSERKAASTEDDAVPDGHRSISEELRRCTKERQSEANMICEKPSSFASSIALRTAQASASSGETGPGKDCLHATT